MFWGMLVGPLFVVPLLGAALGAGIGALTGSLSDIGIDFDFNKSVRDEIDLFPGRRAGTARGRRRRRGTRGRHDSSGPAGAR